MQEPPPTAADFGPQSATAPIDDASNRRFYERLPLDGSFIITDTSGRAIRYRMADISLGGMKLEQALVGGAAGKIIGGRAEVTAGKITVSGMTTCQIVHVAPTSGTRLKFLDIPEEFVEFLRARIWRENTSSDLKADWLSGEAMMTAVDVKPRGARGVLAKIFRIETLAVVLLVGLALLILIRATGSQSFWVTQNYEVIAPINAEITSLQDRLPVQVGETIATLEVRTISGESATVFVPAPAMAQTITWRFNTGDRVARDDIIGFVGALPLSNGKLQVIAAVDSPLYSLRRGDDVVFSNGLDRQMHGRVSYSITPERAAMFSGMDQNALKFDTYQVVELDVPPDVVLNGGVRINHVATLWGRARTFLENLSARVRTNDV